MRLDSVQRIRPLLGTEVEINLVGNYSTKQVETALQTAFNKIERIHNLMSIHNPASELNHLNRSLGKWIPLSIETTEVLSLVLYLQDKTDNRFNCFQNAPNEPESLQPHGTVSDLNSVRPSQTPGLEIKGLKGKLNLPLHICLDGIAKGYAVDAGVEVLQNHGIYHGWISAGGDSRVFGDISLQQMRKTCPGVGNQHSLEAYRNCAISSSQATCSNCFKRDLCILDAEGNKAKPASVSVIASKAWLADALTKVFLLTPESGHQALADTFKVDYFYRAEA
ncbi:FAD:protein FMN transferase [Thiomicrorhabdus sp.]|uniref:FAD:protein FMN transferase n=1 Tax=Thiomicrorhabdus sp. TaxID=2039724 RepID=UPI0029C7187F|nr:FAD:protein FMN transferase [Thiomicrorhabdus sp.]